MEEQFVVYYKRGPNIHRMYIRAVTKQEAYRKATASHTSPPAPQLVEVRTRQEDQDLPPIRM